MLGERVLYCLLVQSSKEKANRGDGCWIEIWEQCRQKKSETLGSDYCKFTSIDKRIHG